MYSRNREVLWKETTPSENYVEHYTVMHSTCGPRIYMYLSDERPTTGGVEGRMLIFHLLPCSVYTKMRQTSRGDLVHHPRVYHIVCATNTNSIIVAQAAAAIIIKQIFS